MVHRAVRCRAGRVQAAGQGRARQVAPPGCRLLRGRRTGHQGHRKDHQPRRQGGRVLDQGRLRGRCRAVGGRRVRAFRVHQRGHQQHQPRADAEKRACRGHAADPGCPDRQAAQHGPCAGCGANAQPNPRSDRQPDHAGQGGGQRRRAADHGARAHRRGAAAGQDERRGRQLQRAPGCLPGCGLGGLQPPGGGKTPRPGAQPAHHPDRAARLHGRAVRCLRALQHHPHRLGTRCLVLRVAGLLQAAVEGRRDRQQHHAAQGQPDRLRECRRQLRPGQRAARPPEPEAADQPPAARPDRQHRAAQHGRGAGLHAAGL